MSIETPTRPSSIVELLPPSNEATAERLALAEAEARKLLAYGGALSEEERCGAVDRMADAFGYTEASEAHTAALDALPDDARFKLSNLATDVEYALGRGSYLLGLAVGCVLVGAPIHQAERLSPPTQRRRSLDRAEREAKSKQIGRIKGKLRVSDVPGHLIDTLAIEDQWIDLRLRLTTLADFCEVSGEVETAEFSQDAWAGLARQLRGIQDEINDLLEDAHKSLCFAQGKYIDDRATGDDAS